MKIAVLPGDGIGPEIVAEAVRVLECLKADGLPVETETALIGGCAVDAAGDPLPDATLKLAQEADAVLLGAVGGPQYDVLPREQRPERGLLRIRKGMNVFSNLRPAVLYPELASASSLRPEIVAGLDIMIVRELVGDIYFGEPRGIEMRNGERVGFNTMIYSESEIRRIAHSAFRIARKRSKRLCSVDKMNVLETTQLWRDVMNELAPEYQRQIDAYARDLYDRVSSSDVDATLPVGGPGLFTDDQGAFLPANETGFASRLAVSAQVDPAAGGQLWRVRAGINAAGAGDVGESSLLNKMSAALAATPAAAAPVVLPEPDAAVKEVMGLIAELLRNDSE